MLSSKYIIGGQEYTAAGIAPTAIECQALCSVLAARMPFILHALSTTERRDVAADLNDVAHAFAVAEAARDVAVPVAVKVEALDGEPLPEPRHMAEVRRRMKESK